ALFATRAAEHSRHDHRSAPAGEPDRLSTSRRGRIFDGRNGRGACSLHLRCEDTLAPCAPSITAVVGQVFQIGGQDRTTAIGVVLLAFVCLLSGTPVFAQEAVNTTGSTSPGFNFGLAIYARRLGRGKEEACIGVAGRVRN